MAKLVSKTYGEALFEVAVEEGTIDSTLEEVQIVLDVIEANEQYIKLLTHPKLPVEQKVSLVEQVFAGKASDTLTGFMVTIVEKGRFSEIEKILTYFIDKVREYKKIGVAYVISAVELSKDEKQEIVQKLLNTTSYVEFIMNYSVDASLIGGVVIRIGDRVVDGSVKNITGRGNPNDLLQNPPNADIYEFLTRGKNNDKTA